MTARKRIVTMALVLLAALLDATISPRLGVGDAYPCFLALVVVSSGLLSNAVWGAVCGFVGGMAVAGFAASPLGVEAIVGALVGYWSGRWGESIIADEHPVPPLLAGIVGVLAMRVGSEIVSFLVTDPSADLTTLSAVRILVMAAWAVLLALPVYRLTRRMCRDGVGARVRAHGDEAVAQS